MQKNNRIIFTSALLILVLLSACYGLYPRVRLESSDKNVAILADYREITALAKNSGLEVDEAVRI